MTQILDTIEGPEDVRKLDAQELATLAREIRTFLVETVSKTGGHLAPSLGTVELTLALYRVFSFPEDKLVWDVGHQAYTHKILTGRRASFHTLRQKGGITGFPNRFESPYDAFGVGHASTAISAALGMAVARDLESDASKKERHVIAVLGDGALTGGESFEGLNNAGDLGKRLIVILNDNGRSIDKNVGAMSEYLSALRIAPQYNRAKKDVEHLLKSIPRIGGKVYKTASAIKDGVRTALVPGAPFEEIGFRYIGPIDGHNLDLLIDVFSQVRQMQGPILVHVHTKKGKGYLPAEEAPEKFHGIGKFDAATGECPKKEGAPSYTSVFSDALIELAKTDEDIVAITAAMPSGTGLKAFGKAYPERFFDVGIAEEHAVTFAAGLAAAGKKPVVALYSTFAQRAYDQILHDVCLQKLPVVFALDRAGLVGQDGPTHHGVFDYSYLRHLPGMTVMAPKDEAELRDMMKTALALGGPVAVRYPRGAAVGVTMPETMQALPLGKAEVLRDKGAVAMLAVGSMVQAAEKAADLLAEEGIAVRVVNMRFVKPLDTALLLSLVRDTEVRGLVTLEENMLAGGFGSAVLEALSDAGVQMPVRRFGIGDTFVEQGTREELLELCGLTAPQIAEGVKTFLRSI
ncbi:MAG: 1-deoxy-D-xylulose-5-phosphate synthase [Selenomonas sp.]|uniref:1-deoxy-D-xylulose-5-phosphate synthase n=1 Tax=Selenomonas sp. TaxID=2053611 RepID=UPI0025D3B3CC|nr:1-deoxy-D-xylulose-5-phosphate synthase [Selenomonas sp.]MCI6099971.1 1-deoxy-D-xylulose-5-phosphate synthase [Selenomonas sp.]MCI6232965.1 1-deoxy-D-xylulose-5-phosphate synthase [Selenomonas sp.]